MGVPSGVETDFSFIFKGTFKLASFGVFIGLAAAAVGLVVIDEALLKAFFVFLLVCEIFLFSDARGVYYFCNFVLKA